MILEAVLESNIENGLGKDTNQIIIEPIIKRRGDDMCNTDTLNMARTSDGMSTGDKKGYYSRVPIEMWDRRA